MDIRIVGKKMHISDFLDSDIRNRADKLKRFYDRIVTCQVTVEKAPLKYRVDVVSHVPGRVLKTSHEHEKEVVSVGQAMDKMERQLRKFKSKQSQKWAPGLGKSQELVADLDEDE